MRIACVYIPSFPLQAALVGHRDLTDGGDGSVGGVAVVAQPANGSPVVVACSRVAWTAGVRPGMSAAAARAVEPDVRCVFADVAAERAMLKAVGEAVLGIAPRVELGGDPRGQHHVMYVEVPAGKRGSWFGGKLRELLAMFGLRGRIGIADDRFTAYVAAVTSRGGRQGGEVEAGEESVVCVPRGGSAAFLAPQPLSLLPLGPEVLHMLEALGVKTLGAFAALPPPSVARPERGDAWDSDFQALARGDGGAALDAFEPSGPISERVTVHEDGLSLGAAVEGLAQRLAARLAGRNAVPADMMMRLERVGGLPAIRSLAITEASAEDLADMIGRALGSEPWERIEVVARPVATPAVMPQGTSAWLPGAAVAPAAVAAAPRHELEPIAPLVLLPSPAAYGQGDRGERVEHRRTRRGKQRPRIGVGQARLFVGD